MSKSTKLLELAAKPNIRAITGRTQAGEGSSHCTGRQTGARGTPVQAVTGESARGNNSPGPHTDTFPTADTQRWTMKANLAARKNKHNTGTNVTWNVDEVLERCYVKICLLNRC